jgi:hypothetical protein
MVKNWNSFVYYVEDEPYYGTITDYATALMHAHYEAVNVSDTVTMNGQEITPTIELVYEDTENDYGYYKVSAFGDDEEYRIDRRA